MGQVGPFEKKVWHLTGGSACFCIFVYRRVSVARKVGLGCSPDTGHHGQMHHDFHNCCHFSASVRCFGGIFFPRQLRCYFETYVSEALFTSIIFTGSVRPPVGTFSSARPLKSTYRLLLLRETAVIGSNTVLSF